MGPVMKFLIFFLGLGAGFFSASDGHAEALATCAENEIMLPAQALVFNGPATGYSLFGQNAKERCVRVMKQTKPEGWFLVLWNPDKNEVAWWPHPKALVRFNSDNEKRERAVLPETRYVIKRTTGHAGPNFGAEVTHWLPVKEQVVVLEQVPSRLWIYGQFYVDDKVQKAWFFRMHLSTNSPDGQPDFKAGRIPWVTTEPPAEQTDAGPRLDETQRKKASAIVDKSQKSVRGIHRLEFEVVSATSWQEQRFLTDAVNDTFARYAMETMAGGALGSVRYIYRDWLLAELGGALQGAQLEIPSAALPKDSPTTSTPLFWSNVHANVGFKVHQTQKAKVQGLLGYSLDYLWSPIIDGFAGIGQMPAIVNGMYHQVRPGIRVLLNSTSPTMGYLALEAALPVGIYQMYPDPLETYITFVSSDEKYRLNPPATVGEGLPEFDEEGNATSTEVSNDRPISRGFDARFLYHWPFNKKIELLGGMAFVVRDTDITGPGFRTASFWEASQMDMMVTIQLGAKFHY